MKPILLAALVLGLFAAPVVAASARDDRGDNAAYDHGSNDRHLSVYEQERLDQAHEIASEALHPRAHPSEGYRQPEAGGALTNSSTALKTNPWMNPDPVRKDNPWMNK